VINVNRMWEEEDGILSFEWTLLATILTIGLVTGISGARDAVIDEFGDVAQAMLAFDQSYTIAFPLVATVHVVDTTSSSNSEFVDAAAYSDCTRTNGPLGEGDQDDFGA
jgi:Flp pilus assembly pilin Flp